MSLEKFILIKRRRELSSEQGSRVSAARA